MTPSQQAKSVGLKSLTQVSQITGVSLQTLTNWHRGKPDLFKTVLIGCIYNVTDDEHTRLKSTLDEMRRDKTTTY